MENKREPQSMPFGQRLSLAFRILFNGLFAGEVEAALEVQAAKPATLPPEQVHASGLLLLGALQREGRLLDFLQQDVSGYSDEQVGAAARVVHSGCRKLLHQYFDFEPAAKQPEGEQLEVPRGFDAQRWRLTGNVAGQPPYKGTLRHHGWVARQVRMPAPSAAIDPRVLAPAEVELA